jgi:hypothetical protein
MIELKKIINKLMVSLACNKRLKFISLRPMAAEIKTKLTLTQSLVDEGFDSNKTSTYQFIIQLGINEIRIAILDKQKNKFIALETYSILNAYNFNAVADVLPTLFKESKITNHKFQKVSCIVDNSLSTLVPSPLYEDDRKKLYLKFNASLEGDELIVTDEIKSLDAINVFALPVSVKGKMDAQFNKVNYHHLSTILIESLLASNKNQVAKKLYVHVQSTHFETLVIEGKNLVFYNTFNYYSPEDFIYYLLFSCEQLHLNPEKIELSLQGDIDRSSALYALIQKYIRTIKFAERSSGFEYSHQLQSLPLHAYFTLFNSYHS